MQNHGKVYLVGAGIGDIGYLTLKAKEIITRGEVLIYDALVDSQLLDLVPTDCLTLNVGKRGGKASTPQSQINQLLVTYCLQGKQVVRLKSGDPFIFGRAREEIEALQAANCDFEIIPGISSVLAAPLLANIPLTDKDLSSCFAVFSGHQPEILDWQALAKIETLVILMGGRNLAEIIARLIEQGRSHLEPIAIIRNCGRSEQEIYWGTLTDIVKKTDSISLSPAVIVIGNVVGLNKVLQPKSNSQNLSSDLILSLADKTVLVTRAVEQSSKFSDLLRKEGAKVLEMPALAITAPSSWLELDRAIANLADFDWLILTSANGVEYFFNRLATLGKDARALAGIKIAVVGKKTAATLQQKNLQPDFIPPDFVADSLIENFPETLASKKILFPRVETGGREVLVKELSNQGATVIEVAAYQSSCPEKIDFLAWQAIQNKQIDIVTFASSKTVRNFYQLINKELNFPSKKTILSLLENVCLASIGPQTSQTCYELLARVDVEAKEYTLEGLTKALIEFLRN
jgi:uroporphyrinogen III methyltransferase/synthase